MGDRRRRDGGSTTIVASGLIVVLVGCCAGVLALVGLVMAQHKAAAAADLAALAGAESPLQPCRAATEIATANDADLSSCEARGMVVTVTVTIDVDAPLGLTPRVEARARAGPAPPVS